MRALVLAGQRRVELIELPAPAIVEPTDAVVRVEAAGLCGSDLHPWTGAEAARPGVVAGHEAVGVVEAVGPDVRSHAVGDRVVVTFTTSCGVCGPCRAGMSARCVHGRLFGWGDPDPDGVLLHGCQAELVRVPLADRTLVAVPAELDERLAVLLGDNLPTGWYAATRAGVRAGSTAAVVGLGAVGLCAVIACRALGAEQVWVTDLEPDRVARAVALGGTPLEADADAVADHVVEAAGPSAAQHRAARLARPGGTVSIIAVQTGAALGIPPTLAYDRNLTLRLGRAAVRSVLDDLLPRVLSGEVAFDVGQVVTHRLPLADGPQAYTRFAGHEPGMVKALLVP